MHCGRFTRCPDPDPLSQISPLDGIDEGVAGRRPRSQITPLDGSEWMVREGEAGIGLCHLDDHADRGLHWKGFQKLTDGGDGGLISRHEERRRGVIDPVTAPGARDGCRVPHRSTANPIGRGPAFVKNNLQFELAPLRNPLAAG